jgi:hypothetical protein
MEHSIWHHLHHARHGPPLKKPKNPLLAFLAGFMFGPIGAGLYLGSWFDFLALMAILLLASCGTAGVAAPVAWSFSGIWAGIRASSSNTH